LWPLVPRPIAEFARIGEKAADTFERLEKGTRESLSDAVREFATTKNWPALSDEQTVMLYFRLSYGVDLTMALSTCTTNLFPGLENRDSEMNQWAAKSQSEPTTRAASLLRARLHWQMSF
jgi:hypothetical protein